MRRADTVAGDMARELQETRRLRQASPKKTRTCCTIALMGSSRTGKKSPWWTARIGGPPAHSVGRDMGRASGVTGTL